MKKFEVFFNIPSPYRLHLLRALCKELKERGVEFEAHFMARGHANRPKAWLNPVIDFPHRYWSDWGLGEHHFNPGLVLHGIFHPADWTWNGSPYDTFTGILAALLGRCPNKIAGAEGNTKTPGIMTGFVGWFKHLIYSRCRYAAVPGSDAISFMAMHQSHTRMRMPQPVVIPNLVDETRFLPRAQWPKETINARRNAMGAVSEGMKICLIPARLDEVKGLVPFLENLEADWLAGWRIVILGQGPLKQTLLDAAVRKGLADRVAVLDYVSYDEMPSYYAAADLLLLPSIYDPNPLSVPEALFSGLPIALSDQAGNVEEGVTEGRNGWRLPVKDPERYPRVLKEVFTASREVLARMGRCSLEENASFWRSEAAVKRYLDGLGVKG